MTKSADDIIQILINDGWRFRITWTGEWFSISLWKSDWANTARVLPEGIGKTLVEAYKETYKTAYRNIFY